MERAPAGEGRRRWKGGGGARSKWGGGVTGGRTEPPARGRPLVATLEDQGQLSRKGGSGPPGPGGQAPPHPPPPTLPSFDIYCEPGGVQVRLERSPTPLSPWARRQDFGLRPIDHPPCPEPGGGVVRMYSIILFWKSNASSFLILYKEETNKVCFCVYCLFIVL